MVLCCPAISLRRSVHSCHVGGVVGGVAALLVIGVAAAVWHRLRRHMKQAEVQTALLLDSCISWPCHSVLSFMLRHAPLITGLDVMRVQEACMPA